MIEELGLRGHKIGGAMVSEKHCNFIVNDDLNATAQDVRDYEFMKLKLEQKKNITLTWLRKLSSYIGKEKS